MGKVIGVFVNEALLLINSLAPWIMTPRGSSGNVTFQAEGVTWQGNPNVTWQMGDISFTWQG